MRQPIKTTSTTVSRRIRPGDHAVVVGTGKSGLAAAELLSFLGATVRIVDSGEVPVTVRDQAAKLGWEVLEGAHKAKQFDQAALVVLSPGVIRRNLEPWLTGVEPKRVIAELELGLDFVTEPIIAVTGTSGKTTTTTLIGEFLRAMGKKVFVGGNIGTPLSRYVLERMITEETEGAQKGRADCLVLEVSSFQLLNTTSLHPKIGVLLNVSPNHLDYHQDMGEYLQAKLSLFARQKAEDTAIISEELRDLVETHGAFKARSVYFGSNSGLTCPALPGRHNQANIAAAFQACLPFGLTMAGAQQVLNDFAPLPHRLQIVAERDGVLFVDDSKGTTVQALRAALEAFERPMLLLAGGVFKGGDLAGLNTLIQRNVRAIGLFGASREVFETAWLGSGVPMSWDPKLEQAMDRLWSLAQPGDVLLLSPATASFDLFRDYKHRGMAFQHHLQNLPEAGHG